ncbi:hypothetical protein WG902_19240 [Ramlibacter sp. PS3R-8]|uniref:hypothetical protein n=1 Tax=Ramlibacter sp. PS3R-8 TaxID=3133437 RepID=UPI003095A939
MARFVLSTEHGGVNRMARGFAALGSFNITIAALHTLSAIGSPVTRAAGAARSVLAGWSAARKQRAADRRLWDLALTDARIMADLSRAMGRDAADIGRND